MIAVFKTGGKQYCVEPGQVLKVDKLEGEKGDSLTFNEILILNEKNTSIIGTPIIKDASIKAKIIDQIRGEKIIVFKKRRRKNYKSTRGHRQYLTVLRIESINNKDIKASSDKIPKKIEQQVSKTKTKDKIQEKKIAKKSVRKVIKKKVDPQKIEENKKITKKTIVKKTTKSK